jgi:S1-C subfamily serine protease
VNAFCVLALLAGEPADELEALQVALEAALDRVAPSVVTIATRGGVRRVDVPDDPNERITTPERRREKEKEEEPEEELPPGGKTERFRNEWDKMLALPGFKKAEGPTTGLVVSRDGHIVTSAWNFESKPNVIVVTLHGGEIRPARLLGIDRAAGLALLKIDAGELPVPEFLDPRDVHVGAWAIALGRALAQDRPEVKLGVVSAKNRVDGKALQTDAACSPTNYGGPLIDVEGRVYGVIVPLGGEGGEANPNWYDSGIGFAVPIPDPAALVRRLGVEGAVLLPAFLGVEIDQDRTEPGARVVSVVEDSPAAKAGLAPEDIVTAVDGEAVENAFALRFAVGARRAGDVVKLALRRGDRMLELEVTLGEPRSGPASDKKVPVPMPSPENPPGGGKEDEPS